MTTELLITATVLVAAGLLLLRLGTAQRRGRLRRNLLVGLRTPTTLAGDPAWAAAHAATAPGVMAGGSILAIGGATALLLRPAETATAETVLAIPAVLGAVVLLITAFRGQRAAKAARSNSTTT